DAAFAVAIAAAVSGGANLGARLDGGVIVSVASPGHREERLTFVAADLLAGRDRIGELQECPALRNTMRSSHAAIRGASSVRGGGGGGSGAKRGVWSLLCRLGGVHHFFRLQRHDLRPQPSVCLAPPQVVFYKDSDLSSFPSPIAQW